MACKNASIVEKAKRLVGTCSERSLKHDDNVPCVFRYYAEGYKGEVKTSVFEHDIQILKRLYSHSSVGNLPFGTKCIDGSGRIVHRVVSFIYDEMIQYSILRCLAEYSDLQQDETAYDEMLDCCLDIDQFRGWERGMCLLTDFYSENRKGDIDNYWMLEWSDIFDAIRKAALPFTQEPPKDLRPSSWFEANTDVKGSGLKQISSVMLRNAVRDGNLNNWKQRDKPNANNQYSIKEVKDFYKEYAHILPNE